MLTFEAVMQKLDAICKQTDHGGGHRSVTLQPRVAGLAAEKKHNTNFSVQLPEHKYVQFKYSKAEKDWHQQPSQFQLFGTLFFLEELHSSLSH